MTRPVRRTDRSGVRSTRAVLPQRRNVPRKILTSRRSRERVFAVFTLPKPLARVATTGLGG
jgi:hypothetical protein